MDSYEVAKVQLDIGTKSLTEYMKTLCKKYTPTAIEMTAVTSNVVHWKAPSIMNDQKIISYCKRTSYMNCSCEGYFGSQNSHLTTIKSLHCICNVKNYPV